MASVRVDNLSRPGTADFYLSDKWIVLIHGAAPNTLVTNTVKRNDCDWSATPYGYTSPNIDLYLIGSMGPGDIGTWTEIWKVGGVEVSPTLTGGHGGFRRTLRWSHHRYSRREAA